MRLYFIRHGQSANNALWDKTQDNSGRVADPELTDGGQQQARLVAQFIAGQQAKTISPHHNDHFGITHLYSSLMVRAMDTADAIAEAIDLPPVAWPEIHETGGIWQRNRETDELQGLPGKNRADFEARYPNFILPNELTDQGWWNRPFEDMEGFVKRGRQVVEMLHARHGDSQDRVAIVSHGGFYNVLIGTLLNLPLTNPPAYWFALNNTGVTRFDFNEQRVRIAYHNRVDFLPPELVT